MKISLWNSCQNSRDCSYTCLPQQVWEHQSCMSVSEVQPHLSLGLLWPSHGWFHSCTGAWKSLAFHLDWRAQLSTGVHQDS